MEKAEQAYREILELLNKHKEYIVFDVEILKQRSEYHLFGLELKEKYGFNIDPKRINSLDWNRLEEDISIGWWGPNYNRTIGCSDDESQPENELLLKFWFSTGPFIFGRDYKEKVFERFFSELKTYSPKYTDSRNHALYFTMDNGGKVWNDFDTIFKKYQEEYNSAENQRLKEKLRKQLAKLESNEK